MNERNTGNQTGNAADTPSIYMKFEGQGDCGGLTDFLIKIPGKPEYSGLSFSDMPSELQRGLCDLSDEIISKYIGGYEIDEGGSAEITITRQDVGWVCVMDGSQNSAREELDECDRERIDAAVCAHLENDAIRAIARKLGQAGVTSVEYKEEDGDAFIWFSKPDQTKFIHLPDLAFLHENERERLLDALQKMPEDIDEAYGEDYGEHGGGFRMSIPIRDEAISQVDAHIFTLHMDAASSRDVIQENELRNSCQAANLNPSDHLNGVSSVELFDYLNTLAVNQNLAGLVIEQDETEISLSL